MPAPLVPATPAFAPDGTPVSPAYGDVYHSPQGGEAQARHVFLAGNGLPERWQGRARFTVLETGFGLGLNFLATWRAWREDSRRCARLHYVSLEKHPFDARSLAALHAPHAQLAVLSAELRDAWPMLVPGLHRLAFDNGMVVLTLAFGDAVELLPKLRLAADAIFLDGFAPAKNPDLWSRPLLKRLARLAATGATAATWSVAAEVRAGLAGAGFAAEKRPGFGAKREMLAAVALPRRDATPVPPPQGRVLVIGAGIAGASACERFATRGCEVTLVERRDAPATEASGNHAGAFHPLVTRDDSVYARLTRAAFLHWHNRRRELDAMPGVWSRCGVLQLARNDKEEAAQREAIRALAYPPAYACWVEPGEAAAHAGMAVSAGGLWFPESGWMRPPRLARALLDACGAKLTTRFGVEVASLARAGGEWRALDAAGNEIARAPVVVLANATDALRLAPDPHVRLRRVRGQVTHLPGERFADLRCVALRGGMVLPPVDGISVAGASFEIDDDDAAVRVEGHAGNLERVARILTDATAGLDPAALEGRVGWRAVVPDRLPMLGSIDDARGAGLYAAYAYGSRGLLWAGLGAELIASQATGDPLPIDVKLADAVLPARFRARAARRATSP